MLLFAYFHHLKHIFDNIPLNERRFPDAGWWSRDHCDGGHSGDRSSCRQEKESVKQYYIGRSTPAERGAPGKQVRLSVLGQRENLSAKRFGSSEAERLLPMISPHFRKTWSFRQFFMQFG